MKCHPKTTVLRSNVLKHFLAETEGWIEGWVGGGVHMEGLDAGRQHSLSLATSEPCSAI